MHKRIHKSVQYVRAVTPSPFDSSVALDSVIAGKCGLIRSSIVTVAKELKADEMVLVKNMDKIFIVIILYS